MRDAIVLHVFLRFRPRESCGFSFQSLETLQRDLRSLVDLIQEHRLEGKQQTEGLQGRIAALERSLDSKWVSLEGMLKGAAAARPSGVHFEDPPSDAQPLVPLRREERSSNMKRSFLTRFLEEEEEDAAPKDAAERIKDARFEFLERIFGICEADPKKGREASKVIHPQSPFATGPPPPTPPRFPLPPP